VRMFVRRTMGMRDYANLALAHNLALNGLHVIDSNVDPKPAQVRTPHT